MSDTPVRPAIRSEASEVKLQGRIDLAAERSRRAREIAAQHEALALTDSAPLRDLHHRMAAIHRRMEQRHLITVDLYASVLASLRRPETVDAGRQEGMPSLLSATADLAGSAGAVMALFDSSQTEALFLASDSTARRAHDLEFKLGEGPAIDATRTRCAVTASGAEICDRWRLYGPEAGRAGCPCRRRGTASGWPGLPRHADRAQSGPGANRSCRSTCSARPWRTR